MSKKDPYKYRLIKPCGRYLNAGTDRPSWFTLDQARRERDKLKGSVIVETNGTEILWEVF